MQVILATELQPYKACMLQNLAVIQKELELKFKKNSFGIFIDNRTTLK